MEDSEECCHCRRQCYAKAAYVSNVAREPESVVNTVSRRLIVAASEPSSSAVIIKGMGMTSSYKLVASKLKNQSGPQATQVEEAKYPVPNTQMQKRAEPQKRQSKTASK
ncbi:hypothetical protein ON010_g9384 [Phytophthora cinnamomi]|nr:hypothetical protein ON010_g9384 [Phytophthora cinnamomi]